MDIDFEGTDVQEQNVSSVQNSATTSTQDDKTHLNGGGLDDITGKDNSSSNSTQATQQTSDDNIPSTGGLNVGDTVELDDATYTVDEQGNLVDDKGNIFKEAKDVADWLKSVEVEDANDNNGSLSLSSIQEKLGVTITDENGQPVEFTEDAEGVQAYIDSVIGIRSQELQEAAINRLYQDNPLLKQFQDYVQLTGSPRGFGEIPDRSAIHVEKDNEHQQIAIIRMAAQEFGNRSLNDNYIKYLRDSGGLYDEARNQLKALQEKDEAYRKDIELRAAMQREEEAKSVANYWSNVDKLINSRVIAGYRLPESFTKEVEGKKVVITPKDFFNYVSNPSVTDESGRRMTNYQADLAKLTDEEYLNREMLDAWLMFTGGTYKDLIDMAVKEDKVRQLRIKSKEQRSTKSVKVVRAPKGKANIEDIVL